MATRTVAAIVKTAENRPARRNDVRCSLPGGSRCARHTLIPSTTAPDVASALRMVWANEPHNIGLPRSSQKLVSTAWPWTTA